MVLGATSTVLWQTRHAGSLILIGLPRYSERPSGVSLSPIASIRASSLRNWLTMSASHSSGRSRGLVGLSVASLYVNFGYVLRRLLKISVAEYEGTVCGRKLYFICVSSNGLI